MVAIAIERETAAALTLEKAAMREKRQRARIKAVVKHEYEALQRDLIVLEEAVAAAAAAETETRDGGDDGAIDDQAGLSPLAVLIGERCTFSMSLRLGSTCGIVRPLSLGFSCSRCFLAVLLSVALTTPRACPWPRPSCRTTPVLLQKTGVFCK